MDPELLEFVCQIRNQLEILNSGEYGYSALYVYVNGVEGAWDIYPGDEYARVLSGSLTLTGDDGVAQTFSAGDAYTMRRGWRGEFRVTETMTKQEIDSLVAAL